MFFVPFILPKFVEIVPFSVFQRVLDLKCVIWLQFCGRCRTGQIYGFYFVNFSHNCLQYQLRFVNFVVLMAYLQVRRELCSK